MHMLTQMYEKQTCNMLWSVFMEWKK